MKSDGFTLVEVLIALAIVSIALSGLIKAHTQNANNLAYLQQKTLTNLVVSNLAIEQRLGKKPILGYQSGEYRLANRTWPWSIHTQSTVNKDIVKLVLSVYGNVQQQEAKISASELVVYLQK